MTKSSISTAFTTLLVSAATSLSGCANPIVTKALGTIGSSAADTAKKESANKETGSAEKAATHVTAPTTETNIKPASITWGKFEDKFSTNSGLAARRVATAIVWKSPDKEFIKMTFMPSDKRSNIPPKVVTGEISAEACNRTLAGTILSTASNTLDNIEKEAKRAAGLGGATNTPRNTATVIKSMDGLTDEQKTLCTAALETLKSSIKGEVSKLNKEFEKAYKGAKYTVVYEGTNGVELVLGLNNIPTPTSR